MASRGERQRGRSRTPRPVLGQSQTTHEPPAKSSLSTEWKVVSWRPQSTFDGNDDDTCEPEEYWGHDPGYTSPSETEHSSPDYQEYIKQSSQSYAPRYKYAKPRRDTYPREPSQLDPDHSDPWPPRRTSYFTPSEDFSDRRRSTYPFTRGSDFPTSTTSDFPYKRSARTSYDMELDKEIFQVESEILRLRYYKYKRAQEDLFAMKGSMGGFYDGWYTSAYSKIADELEKERRAEFTRKWDVE
ncbi:hypothetical protein P154DRAFT_525658 [Amniculicola lignicola CBS 123094]|uniref:Uncharacterized protein n=1 Tax=Amniculicola lignicola CBS 123094 TaxID=1392246 RepID=A0A6A5W6F5_9PLEO|nr:hypothetical protein P154DRAFT_525658 [Amniculicola lignicola CBS 123094]